MKIAFVRNAARAAVLADAPQDGQLDERSSRWLHGSAKAGSSSKNMIVELQRRGVVSDAAEWRFWRGPVSDASAEGRIPARIFSLDDGTSSPDLAAHVREHGPPDVLWAEGLRWDAHMDTVFALCADSFKVVYSKDWKPWKVEQLARYDLCLVDEPAHVERVERAAPSVRAAVWDKLIDYEDAHVPLACEKRYDICYVGYLRRRKQHELLLRAMARLSDRDLSCVIVGGSPRQNDRAYAEEMRALASDLGIRAEFAGEVDQAEVNRYINESRIGVLCAEKDAAPRAVLEYMAAGVPVLANARLRAGLRYVGPAAGLARDPADFHNGIAELLDNLDAYAPRQHLLEDFSRQQAGDKFVAILEEAGLLSKVAP